MFYLRPYEALLGARGAGRPVVPGGVVFTVGPAIGGTGTTDSGSGAA